MQGFDFTAALYYELMNPPQFESEHIDFHLHYGLRARNVLDFGAGTGRVAIPLAERRIHVTCYDKFPGMLAALTLKAAARAEIQPFLTPVSGDPATIDFKKQFAHAYMSRVLFYIVSDEDRVAAFRNIHRHLEPNATFVVDAPVGTKRAQPRAQFHKSRLGRTQYTVHFGIERLGGPRYRGFATYEEHFDGTLVRSTDTEFEAADIPTKAYMQDLLREAGFTLEEVFVDHRFKPYPATGEADYGVFVARKK